uniref:Uncharacterized protein n=1 Tax=Chlamydomonas euryale TaxID=1486919 RepID=A0A7R9VI78_9CHLO
MVTALHDRMITTLHGCMITDLHGSMRLRAAPTHRCRTSERVHLLGHRPGAQQGSGLMANTRVLFGGRCGDALAMWIAQRGQHPSRCLGGVDGTVWVASISALWIAQCGSRL